MIRRIALSVVLAASVACSAPVRKSAPPKPAPPEYKVKFETTKGDVVILVHRDWAPIGADHFYDLVMHGYYDGDSFFRSIKGFMVQFGINGDPKITARWGAQKIKDDPTKTPNKAGTVTFAKPGEPDARTTHIFINTSDNSDSLDPLGFAPFGEVILGMENVMNIYTGYGDGPPDGTGPDQIKLTHDGAAYLKNFPNLDYIKKATVIDPPPPAPPVRATPARKAPAAAKK